MDDTTSTPITKDPIPQGKATIVLTCAGVGAPLVIRIRRLLKMALRSHGLTCISCELPSEKGGEK